MLINKNKIIWFDNGIYHMQKPKPQGSSAGLCKSLDFSAGYIIYNIRCIRNARFSSIFLTAVHLIKCLTSAWFILAWKCWKFPDFRPCRHRYTIYGFSLGLSCANRLHLEQSESPTLRFHPMVLRSFLFVVDLTAFWCLLFFHGLIANWRLYLRMCT